MTDGESLEATELLFAPPATRAAMDRLTDRHVLATRGRERTMLEPVEVDIVPFPRPSLDSPDKTKAPLTESPCEIDRLVMKVTARAQDEVSRYAQLLELHATGMRQRAIAKELGTSQGWVSVNLRRAIEWRQLAEEGQELAQESQDEKADA